MPIAHHRTNTHTKVAELQEPSAVEEQERQERELLDKEEPLVASCIAASLRLFLVKGYRNIPLPEGIQGKTLSLFRDSFEAAAMQGRHRIEGGEAALGAMAHAHACLRRLAAVGEATDVITICEPGTRHFVFGALLLQFLVF